MWVRVCVCVWLCVCVCVCLCGYLSLCLCLLPTRAPAMHVAMCSLPPTQHKTGKGACGPTHANKHACRVRAHVHAYMPANTHTQTHRHTDTETHRHTHIHTHTYINTHTHTLTHTDMLVTYWQCVGQTVARRLHDWPYGRETYFDVCLK
jgi:hypothetical protein